MSRPRPPPRTGSIDQCSTGRRGARPPTCRRRPFSPPMKWIVLMRASLPKLDFRQTAAMFPSRQVVTGRATRCGSHGRSRSVTARASRRCPRSRCPPGTACTPPCTARRSCCRRGRRSRSFPCRTGGSRCCRPRTQAVPLQLTVPFVGAVHVAHDRTAGLVGGVDHAGRRRRRSTLAEARRVADDPTAQRWGGRDAVTRRDAVRRPEPGRRCRRCRTR